MKKAKEKIIVGCIIIGIIMTIFPPQKISTFTMGGIREEIEYIFIGSNSTRLIRGPHDRSSIAFDRLLLQYLILAGAGFAIYLLASQKEKNVADE